MVDGYTASNAFHGMPSRSGRSAFDLRTFQGQTDFTPKVLAVKLFRNRENLRYWRTAASAFPGPGSDGSEKSDPLCPTKNAHIPPKCHEESSTTQTRLGMLV
jgi:hypothetical protein